MTYLETIKSQNGQIYPEDTFSHVAAHIYSYVCSNFVCSTFESSDETVHLRKFV